MDVILRARVIALYITDTVHTRYYIMYDIKFVTIPVMPFFLLDYESR